MRCLTEPAIVGSTSQRKLSASFLVSKNPVAPSGLPADEARQGQELLATDSLRKDMHNVDFKARLQKR
jgi:hypothetical protein